MLRRAVAALDEIAAEPGHLRLVDLCERLGLAKSTTRRLLVGLVEVGLVSVDSHGRFALGERLLGFGSVTGAHIAAAFRPTVERVARATDGETVDLSVLRGQRMWFVTRSNRLTGCVRSQPSGSASR
ncbi:IclR family transcriptional regulator [Mycobacterium tuberculosis]|nr:IclR family transcriptional regulator [Mycobacterium tuberculosis]